MAITTRSVKQLIAQKRKTVTDRQFFISRILAAHFERMAAAQTRRYGYSRKVKVRIVWEPKNPGLACTENEFIWINAGYPMITGRRSRQERYDLVCGFFAHELGHILYTDFLSGQTYLNKLEAGKWYPEKPLLRSADERRHEADIWDYVKEPKSLQAFLQVAHHLHNILEDGYIESKMLSRYPGVLGSCLEVLRRASFADMNTLTQMIEREDAGESHIWESIMGLILSYVKWGEIKYGDEPLPDERVQIVFSLIGELDAALCNPSSKERLNTVNTILIRCWPYIKEFLEFCEKNSAASGSGGSASDLASAIMSKMAGASKAAVGTSTPVYDKSGSAPASAGTKRTETSKLAEDSTEPEAGSEEESTEEENTDTAGGGDEESSEEETTDEIILPEPEDDSPPASDPLAALDTGKSEDGSDSEAQDVTADEGARIPLSQTDRLYEPVSGGVEYDKDYTGTGYANSARDIERILDQVAEETACAELESTRTADLNELANGISYGDIHSGVSFMVHRMASIPEELIEEYNSVAPPLLHISKQLQRSITQQLRDKRRGGKQTGLLLGRRLDVHALPRNDGHIFYKNSLPVEAPELAVGLLLDESGSMACGDRATYARAAAIILHDFCKSLRIPVMVYGHSESTPVDLYSYAEFDTIDNNDRYRLMDVSARGNNRDGAALRFMAERLSKRPEDVKLLILISDGQPYASGYYGTAAEEDLRGIQQEYRRKGILFIAASIGDDRENLQRIYGDAYMDITDLSRLPIQLTQVVKRHIRI